MTEQVSGAVDASTVDVIPQGHRVSVSPIERRIESARLRPQGPTFPSRVDGVDLRLMRFRQIPLIETETDRNVDLLEQEIYTELESKFPEVEKLIGEALLDTADVLAYLDPIAEGTPKKDPSMKERVDVIDNAATDGMIRVAKQFTFQVDAHGEGFWDIIENNQDIRLMQGEFGSGSEKLSLWTDAIDNTEAASWGTPRAISAAVLAPENGLVEMPGRHFQKLVIPDTVEGVDVSSEPDDVFAAVLKDAGFELPEDRKKLIVTMLDRDANAEIKAAAERAGVTIVIWNGGDVLPIASAGKQPDGTVRMMHTRGGGPELTIGGGIVTAINNAKREGESGLSLSAREWNEDPEKLKQNKVITQKDLVPGGEAIVVIGFLTDDADGEKGTGIKGLPIYKKQPIPSDQEVNLLKFGRNGRELTIYQRKAA